MMRRKLFYGSMVGAVLCGASVAFSQQSAQSGAELAPGDPLAQPPGGGTAVFETGPGQPNAYYAPMMIGRTPGSSREGELNAKVQESLKKYTAAKDDDARQAARKQ